MNKVAKGERDLFNSPIPILKKKDISSVKVKGGNIILQGDAKEVLSNLPAEIANTLVTSPPYFGQRDYGCSGQIGLEKTPQEYVDNLVSVFQEAKRVLRHDGTVWLNIGDKYLAGGQLGMPWRVALALIEDGWFLRSDVIWHKPNAMPSSVKNRPTTDHEYLFLFSKQSDYHYDADSIREPHVTFGPNSKMRGGRNHFGKKDSTPEKGKNGGNPNLHNGRWDQAFHPLGRNKRTVWSVPLGKYRGAHFAVFPEKLIEPCIVSSCPHGGLVIDPFFGAGTTGLVALKHGRKFIGIDINEDYCTISQNRLLKEGP